MHIYIFDAATSNYLVIKLVFLTALTEPHWYIFRWFRNSKVKWSNCAFDNWSKILYKVWLKIAICKNVKKILSVWIITVSFSELTCNRGRLEAGFPIFLLIVCAICCLLDLEEYSQQHSQLTWYPLTMDPMTWRKMMMMMWVRMMIVNVSMKMEI